MTDEPIQKLVAELRHPIQRNERYYEPLCARAAAELERLAALAQSDAEPWRCPIGIPPESHNICSAGSCWWCLSDRVKAQADRSGK